MTKEEITLYANKYRKVQKILAVIVILFIFITACVLIGVGLLLILKDQTITSIIIVAIMGILAVVDISLGVRFFIMARNKIKYTKDIECARNYCRIHGIVTNKVEKKEEK